MCGLKCQIIRLESIEPVTAKMKSKQTIIPGSVSKEVSSNSKADSTLSWGGGEGGGAVKELGEGRVYEKHIYFRFFFTREGP